MKVKELRKALKGLNPNAKVFMEYTTIMNVKRRSVDGYSIPLDKDQNPTELVLHNTKKIDVS